VEIKRIFIALCLIFAITLPCYAADVARQVDFMAAGMEVDGDPISGGLIYTYEAGTTTAKTCWTDRDKTTPETNPVVLDSEGRSTTFCDGVYKMVVKESDGTTVVTMDGISYGETGTQTTNLSDYASLSEAIADIGGTKTVLFIDTTDTLNENVTVPSNVTLMPVVRDAITLNGKTLTVNGDIWAGAFEWVIGSGTFAGTPVVQFYDPTWTASTVTDSATPSYKNVTLSEPTLLTPVVADFSNATHSHSSNATGGIITASIRDISRNLAIINASEKTVTITADEVILQDGNGAALRVSSVNETVDITNSGAYGLDVAPELANTWFYIWIIGNSTSHAGLISNSATAPTLPSGYAYKGLLGAVYNDASSNFNAFSQVNGRVQRNFATISTAIIDHTDCGSASWASNDISAYVPSTVKSIYGFTRGVSSGAANAQISGNSSGFGTQMTIFPSAIASDANAYHIVMESQNLYCYKTASGLTTYAVYLSGWEY